MRGDYFPADGIKDDMQMEINLNEERAADLAPKRKSSAPYVVGSIFLILLLLVCGVMTWVSVTGRGTGDMPNVFGWSVYASRGELASIPEDAAIITRRGVSEFSEGESIVYYDPGIEGKNKIAVRFAGAKTEEGAYEGYDENGEQGVLIPAQNIRGRGETYVGFLGKVLTFAHGSYGMYAFGGASVVLLVLLILLLVKCKNRNRGAWQTYMEEADSLPADYRAESREPFIEDDADEPEMEEEEVREFGEDAGEAYAGEEAAEPVDSFAPEAASEASPAPEGAPFGLAIDERYSEPEPEKPSQLRADLAGKTTQLTITGTDSEIELLAKLVDTAVKKRGSEKVIMDIAYGEKTTLTLTCSWQDVGIVSAIVVELQKRIAKKEKEKTDGYN